MKYATISSNCADLQRETVRDMVAGKPVTNDCINSSSSEQMKLHGSIK